MASDGAISPLKINKSTPSASPAKANAGSMPRALAEISPMEKRRNSPSYNQVTKQMIGTGRESSPFESSPYGKASPIPFWKRGESPARFGSENWLDRSDSSPSLTKRPSIERLKQASRVKNSSMFAREQKNEYDPTQVPVIERPLAGNRPLSGLQGNSFGGRNLDGQRQDSNTPAKGHRRGESQNKIPIFNSSTKSDDLPPVPIESTTSSPSRKQQSPTKSSLSNRNTFPRNFDPNNSIWSDEDDTELKIQPARPLRRQAKSVTFDTAPPEINEYEMVTPDPSVASVASGSREGSYDDYDDDSEIDLGCGPNEDDSFDASLEDTDKTPVVLPEDWRQMSPEMANKDLANTFDDPFNSNKDGRGTPSQQWNSYHTRTASVNSDGDSRPLPPVPPFMQNERPASPREQFSIADRVAAAHGRTLPTPPRPASATKFEINSSHRDNSMTLEDRLRLMGLQDSTSPRDSAAMEAARLRKHGLGIHVHEEEVEADDDTPQGLDFKLPRISRESILKKVHSREHTHTDLDTFNEDISYGDLDPDVPIPSREASSQYDEHVGDEPDVMVKQEEGDDPIDLYSIPDIYASGLMDEASREGSVIRHDVSGKNDNEVPDDESCYSPDMAEGGAQQGSTSTTDDSGPPTPKQEDMVRTSTPLATDDKAPIGQHGIPDLSLMDDTDFQSGLASYLGDSSTPPPPPEKDNVPQTAQKLSLNMESVHDYFKRAATEDEEEPGTPGSVVHHPITPEYEEEIESPAVPEPQATIKAPGAGLKTRVSATPADLATMAATRRKVSGAEPPPIPEKSPKRLSISLEPGEGQAEETATPTSPTKRRQSFRGLDLDMDDSFGDDISFGLDKEFDRVIESSKVLLQFPLPDSADFPASKQPSPEHAIHEEQHFSFVTNQPNFADLTPRSKKGYLMRQNTKVVVAKRNFSNEAGLAQPPPRPSSADSVTGTKSANSSPRKPSHERTKSWTTEPWNGKVRRKSIRSLSGSRQAPASGPVPPLPGQASAVSAGLDTVTEDHSMHQEAEYEDGIERGRLFVKVIGVKELELPLPQNERSYFQMTLDNGLHCVTTSWLELGRTAPIGQEFELVVLNDLEFQLTLQTKLTPPAKIVEVAPASPGKTGPKSPGKKSSLSHLLMSPKKRREQERLAKQKAEEEEAARVALERKKNEAARSARGKPNPNASAWDLLHELVGADGSFGRTYVSLKSHEEQCFGRPINVDMPIFNEWALEDEAIASSVKSKRGGAIRRPPYQVGKLTLQLLYVPRPKGVSEDDMPRSMNACIRELREAEEADKREWEGVLSQQGGDCPYWRRRYFRLVGTKLTAYHEATRQPRAKIELAKAVKIIDDKSSLVANPQGNGKTGKGRRKSAFAEEDEGYQFVEEGFRIRFANGETIDFYADKASDKEAWMDVLSRVVGKNAVQSREWARMVLAREKKMVKAQPMGSVKPKEDVQARPMSSDGLLDRAIQNGQRGGRMQPATPSKAGAQREMPPTPQTAPQQGRLGSRRKEVRSMMF